MADRSLTAIAKCLVDTGKGILAADESTGTIAKRLASISVESTETTRRDYRQLLFSTPGINQYISGVILYDETIRQSSLSGCSLVQILSEQGIMPGIKVDKGAKPLAGSPSETVTEGLDSLRERLEEYRTLGAYFTKWRAVLTIGSSLPSANSIRVNAHALARFAMLSQESKLVPIVEPEVLMDGNHTIKQCYSVTESVLKEVFYELGAQGVDFEGMLLKPNMVVSGNSSSERPHPQEIAQLTLQCLLNTVPITIPGIVFLSGGQNDYESTVNLNAINEQSQKVGAPWQLSFSYGRGLQSAPLKVWAGQRENASSAQRAFANRAYVTSMARQGKYEPSMDSNESK